MMEINNKKLNRTRTIINYAIAIVLAGFLIMLSDAIIEDLSSSVREPDYESYKDKAIEAEVEAKTRQFQTEKDALHESQANIRKMIRVAEEKKEAEQQSFDNWLKARGVLGSPEQDPEVMRRLKKQEEYQQTVLDWTAKSDSIVALVTVIRKAEWELEKKDSNMQEAARTEYAAAMNSYSVKVFLMRLLFVGPVLALGIYLFIRKRNHKFAPLFLGFTLFSLYAFFVGLVPYLPSYGGYVRSIVGVLLTIGLGYYAIKKFRDYSERKKAELSASSEERAQKLESDVIEKAYNTSVCPSCGKSSLLKNWEELDGESLTTVRLVSSRYCRYCGLQLKKKCNACKQENYAHFPHCISCGESLK